MYDLNQLRSFVVLAEELHFGRAALRLNMTQSPLSRQIQRLERVLGVALFERSSRSVGLTRAGSFFYPEAKRIIRLSETATDIARRMAHGLEGSVSLGFTATSAYDVLPRLVTACMAQLPSVHLALKEFTTQEQLDALESGEIDLGLVRPLLARPQVPSLLMSQEPLVLALPEGHDLTRRAALHMRDLDRRDFIGFSYDSRYFSGLSEAHFMANGVRPAIVQQIGHIHSILPLVGAGVGLALVPRGACQLGVAGVVFRPIESVLDQQVELHLIWRDTESPPALTERLIAVARSLA
ncbi:LysR family transcriptional regulator [Pseudooceanicola sp. GBMRC 2024]|uniref:LysR family transcriptional regulator n=1 Tax=Pseudooceanicola albus TaxID=2692189 RepID=A0A6L7G1Q3_9RHOB|nr:LysR family transcriptional regulator [Pseudooceanicola albus]MXN17931.1 LysR family transcriptional regulator [Pseudooceanicola albus]